MIIKKAKPYFYILPAILLAFLFIYYPFIKNIISSFFDISIKGELVSFRGVKNYIDIFKDDVFYLSLKNTIVFMLLFVPINTAIVIIAVVLSVESSRYERVLSSLFLLPMTIGLSSISLLFKFMFNETNGIINSLLKTDIPWFSSTLFARLSLVILGIFLDFTIDYLLLYNAYKNLDKGPIEAAAVDGCTSRELFFKIKLPLLLPTLSFIVFIAIKDAFLICAPVMLLTEGGPGRSTQTIVLYYYLSAFKNSAFSKAATISTLVMVIASLFILLYKKYESRRITFK